MKKIISISVWGNKPQYCVGAIKNAEIAKKLMPDWICRIFVDNTVPVKYQQILYDMDNVEIAEVDSDGVFGAFWRFYSMFEDEKNIVLSRDSDSRISERELKCVNEWIESDKKFSVIRDHERHYDFPVLAGMWGCKGKLSEEIYKSMFKYSHKHFYTSDQIFLAKELWPIMVNDCMIHGIKEGGWFSESRKKIEYDFIGQGYDENENPLYSKNPSGKKL